MDRAVANASRSWFLALKPPVPFDPLAHHIACPDLAEPLITPYVTVKGVETSNGIIDDDDPRDAWEELRGMDIV